jgi:hypothetical protein
MPNDPTNNVMRPRSILKAPRLGLLSGALLFAAVVLASCGSSTPSGRALTGHSSKSKGSVTTTTCPLNKALSTTGTLPVGSVCSSSGTPHFESPTSAMTYLATAWNSGNVQQLDYVTDPNGRDQMNSMAAQMVNLQFKSCTLNPAGDYTCYFMHNIAPNVTGTTYPNPEGYPPGEAVFTVAPAATPGWYLTEVEHCG